MQHNLDGSHVDPTWPTKFAITLWYIWKWRCAHSHNAIADIPTDIGEFLLFKFQEVLQALEKGSPDAGQPRSVLTEQWVCWEPPMGGWTVLNTDGAARGNLGPEGAGGVLRNDKGEWMTGFSEYLGHCSAMKAELKAVLRGLNIAKDMGVEKLWLRIDSRVLLDMLTTQKNRHPEYHFLVHSCKLLLDRTEWEVQITHCFRETNQVADILAHIGTTGSLGVRMYHDPPREIQDALYADRMGILWPRRIRN